NSDTDDDHEPLAWHLYAKRAGAPLRAGVAARLSSIFSPTLLPLHITVVVDNSAAMAHAVEPGSGGGVGWATRQGDPNDSGGVAAMEAAVASQDPLPAGATRWEEAAVHVAELAALAQAGGAVGAGVDVRVTGGGGAAGLADAGAVRRAFAGVRHSSGGGGTSRPVNALVAEILGLGRAAASSERQLVILLLAGGPTDGGFRKLYGQLAGLPAGAYATLVNCNEGVWDDTAILQWEDSIVRFHGQSYYAEELRVVRVAAAAAAASGVAGSATTPTSLASQLSYGRAAYVQDMVVGPFFPGDADEVRRR
ncbi:hypothetical protein HK405_000211, partial [Cladochytrium tenue]